MPGPTDTPTSLTSHTTHASPDQHQQHHHIRLACQACQRKKIKCSRTFPCEQCTRSSLPCVPSTRKPRARHAGKRAVDSELRSRISKLESLVESLSGENGVPPPDASPDSRDADDDDGGGGGDDDDDDADDETRAAGGRRLAAASPAVGKYIGGPFWSTLTTEVQALRDALEDEQAEEDGEASPATGAPPAHHHTEYDLIICPPGSIYVMPGALNEPSPDLSSHLGIAFCENVDRMFKIFHSPTLRRFIVEGKPYLGYDPNSPACRALRASAWFAATNSFTEDQCQSIFAQSRSEQLQQFRRLADVAFAQADLLTTNDLPTLQAFITYLAAARLTDTSRRVWTLTSLAVRIARAMGLHTEATPRSPFETELRRRLWHQIRFLDVFSGIDRGTELLIGMGSFETLLPKRVNDSEFDEHSTAIPDHETGLTDMAFARLAQAATALTHRLSIPETKAGGDTWQQRLAVAREFGDGAQERIIQYCDQTDPFERTLAQIARSMTCTMQLRAVRPMQKHVSSVPPRVDSPLVMQLALDSLKHNDIVQSDPETGRWRWMVWVQWHPLAIAFAGLCLVRDTELADELWVYVERAYVRYVSHVADAKLGMLWRPIEKLRKKAIEFRDTGTTTSSMHITPPGQSLPYHAAALGTTFSSPTTAAQQPPPQHQQFPNGVYRNPNTPAAQQTQGPPQQPTSVPLGAMPTDGVLNGPMDFAGYDGFGYNPSFLAGGAGLMDMGTGGDLSWMDFERIMEDMSNPVGPGGGSGGGNRASMDLSGSATSGAGAGAGVVDLDLGGVTLGDVQWPATVPAGQDWPCTMHQNLM